MPWTNQSPFAFELFLKQFLFVTKSRLSKSGKTKKDKKSKSNFFGCFFWCEKPFFLLIFSPSICVFQPEGKTQNTKHPNHNTTKTQQHNNTTTQQHKTTKTQNNQNTKTHKTQKHTKHSTTCSFLCLSFFLIRLFYFWFSLLSSIVDWVCAWSTNSFPK